MDEEKKNIIEKKCIQIRIRIHFGPGSGFTFSKCGSEDPDPLLQKGGSEDPDPLYPNVDPRIHITMGLIHNTGQNPYGPSPTCVRMTYSGLITT